MHKVSQSFSSGVHFSTWIPKDSKIVIIASLAMGILGSSLTRHCAVARADDGMQHVMDEILQHAIWHHVGHVVHLGSSAASLLGALLSCQSLGEPDALVIRSPIGKPCFTKEIDPFSGKFVDCLVLSNGKKIMGRDAIWQFLQDLKYAQLTQKRMI